MTDNSIQDLRNIVEAGLRVCQKGYSLPQAFYTADDFFAVDRASVFDQCWLFACHSCEIPRMGDFRSFDFGSHSLLLSRTTKGDVCGLFNTCRHRGSRICDQQSGHASKFVCPYHQWTYGLDGSLLNAPRTPDNFARESFSLQKVAGEEVAGLIFVSFADQPINFAPVRAAIADQLTPHDLLQGKIAHQIRYSVNANWKLIFENNRECYHCAVNHPEYIRATFDTERDLGNDHSYLAAIEELQQVWKGIGGKAYDINCSSNMTGDWYRANRTPLRPGFFSESIDGQAVSVAMGKLPQNCGTARITTFPNFWCHASFDHAVTTQILPISATSTQVIVTWLVEKHAEEGSDYTLDRLLPFWQMTSEQDWQICERQQKGVKNSAYQPGPYVPGIEDNVKGFVAWYLQQLKHLQVQNQI